MFLKISSDLNQGDLRKKLRGKFLGKFRERRLQTSRDNCAIEEYSSGGVFELVGCSSRARFL